MLELQGVAGGYESARILHDVNLVVPDRSVVAVLGANGAGKTTLLKVATGLLSAQAGRIVLDGVDVTGERPETLARRGLCHIPEGRGIFRDLTVAENLRLQAPPDVDRRAIEIAGDVFPQLAERLDQVAGTLSGGEQQMLALARAYFSSPRVVLLDEVSMGLAPRIVDEIFEHLRALAAQGVSLLVVEQYVPRALEIADYVYILRQGRVVHVAEAGELDDDAVISHYMAG